MVGGPQSSRSSTVCCGLFFKYVKPTLKQTLSKSTSRNLSQEINQYKTHTGGSSTQYYYLKVKNWKEVLHDEGADETLVNLHAGTLCMKLKTLKEGVKFS